MEFHKVVVMKVLADVTLFPKFVFSLDLAQTSTVSVIASAMLELTGLRSISLSRLPLLPVRCRCGCCQSEGGQDC